MIFEVWFNPVKRSETPLHPRTHTYVSCTSQTKQIHWVDSQSAQTCAGQAHTMQTVRPGHKHAVPASVTAQCKGAHTGINVEPGDSICLKSRVLSLAWQVKRILCCPNIPQREGRHTKQLFSVIMLILRGRLCYAGGGSNGVCRAKTNAIRLVMLLGACAGRQVELPQVSLPAPKNDIRKNEGAKIESQEEHEMGEGQVSLRLLGLCGCSGIFGSSIESASAAMTFDISCCCCCAL